MTDPDSDAVQQAKQWLLEHGVAVPDAVDGQPQQPRPRARSARRHVFGAGVDPYEAEGPPPEPVTGDAAEADADPESLARTIVLRKLAAQARTRAELEKALRSRAVPEAAAQSVLDRMEAVGLVDDAGFARDWVESRQQRRYLSKSALRRELTTKGVDRDTIDVALGQVDADDELEAARALVHRRTQAMAGLDRQVRYRRIAGLLGRRGFSSGVVSRVLGETVDERAGGEGSA